MKKAKLIKAMKTALIGTLCLAGVCILMALICCFILFCIAIVSPAYQTMSLLLSILIVMFILIFVCDLIFG